jgi:hypothetical protein
MEKGTPISRLPVDPSESIDGHSQRHGAKINPSPVLGICRHWEPHRPEGDGWFCLAIHDTDDGPVCWWARREVTP